jgi:hypothetical protein
MYFDPEARTGRGIQANMFLENSGGENCGCKVQICKDPLNLSIFA